MHPLERDCSFSSLSMSTPFFTREVTYFHLSPLAKFEPMTTKDQVVHAQFQTKMHPQTKAIKLHMFTDTPGFEPSTFKSYIIMQD